MAFTAIKSGIWYPRPFEQLNASGNNTSIPLTDLAMTASGHKVAWIVRIPKTGTLGKFSFRAQVTTGADIKVSFQDVDAANGVPDGTIDQYRVIASGSIGSTPKTGLITSDGTDGGTKRSVARGDLMAIVVEWNSSAGSVAARGWTSFNRSSMVGGCYNATYNGTAWSKSANVVPIGALEYDDGSYALIPDLLTAQAMNSPSYGSGASPNEYGLKFTPPVNCKVAGFWVSANIAGDATVTLYDANTTALATKVLDKDITPHGASAGSYFVFFDSDVQLTAGSVYRLALKPNTTTAITLQRWNLLTGTSDQYPGGSALTDTRRTGSGAWTDDVDIRPFMGFYISEIEGSTAQVTQEGVINRGIN